MCAILDHNASFRYAVYDVYLRRYLKLPFELSAFSPFEYAIFLACAAYEL